VQQVVPVQQFQEEQVEAEHHPLQAIQEQQEHSILEVEVELGEIPVQGVLQVTVVMESY
jgi:hypothetical protein